MVYSRVYTAILVALSVLGTSEAFLGALPLRSPVVSSSIAKPICSVAAGKRLYDRAGGAGTIDTCVEDFYDRLEDDEDLSDALVFKKSGLMSINSIKDSQWNMMRFAFKGRPTDGPLRLVDLATSLNGDHWDALMEHMNDTFEFLAIDDDIVEEAMENVKMLEDLFKKRK